MVDIDLYYANERLAEILEQEEIEHLQLTSCGNSIASGFSYSSNTIPLLLRNPDLESSLAVKDITLTTNHFSRFQNNNDENVFEWLITNASQYEMNAFAAYDDGKMKGSVRKLTSRELNVYYPKTTREQTQHFKDIITSKKVKTANIVIYNGGTGSFLDNNSHRGMLAHRLTYGIKRDCVSIEAVLKYIQITNRNFEANTQVYLCGAPRAMTLSSIFINRKLKKIASHYANAVYVSPISRKYIYKMDNNKYTVDIHYNASEYKKFITKIINTIADKYRITQAMITLDRAMLQRSRSNEFSMMRISEQESQRETNQQLDELLAGFKETGVEKDQFLKRAYGYLRDRRSYDFHYITKKDIGNQIKQYKKRL